MDKLDKNNFILIGFNTNNALKSCQNTIINQLAENEVLNKSPEQN